MIHVPPLHGMPGVFVPGLYVLHHKQEARTDQRSIMESVALELL